MQGSLDMKDLKYVETSDGTKYAAAEALAHIVALSPKDAKAEVLRLFNLSQPTETATAPEGQE